jgi:hypothetical protein
MKVWLDSRRQPDVDWVWSQTSTGAVILLRGGCVEKISFAPDQPDLVEPVVDWMIENGVTTGRATHKTTARAKKHRKLLQIPAQDDPPGRTAAAS